MGLQHAVSSAPKGSILVIEDIDCAFPSREDEEEEEEDYYASKPFNTFGMIKPQKTAVTLSGLLNVIDGVGSDEGKIFFTTVRRRVELPWQSPFIKFSSPDELRRSPRPRIAASWEDR